jgi:modulator of FtsH protease
MESWHDFLIALAGASGVLVGLLFVAMSISLDQLLKAPHLISRGAGCLALIAGILMMCCALLVPDLGQTAIAWIILLGAIGLWGVVTATGVRAFEEGKATYRKQGIVAIVFFQLATLPQVAAGIGVFLVGTDALYLLAAGFMIAFIVAVLDSWVLMIEVRR